MAAQRAQLTGIDRLAAMLEPAFPLRMLGFGLIYAWSTCLWDLVLPGTFANDQPLQSSVAWALSAAITPLACLAGCLEMCIRDSCDRDAVGLERLLHLQGRRWPPRPSVRGRRHAQMLICLLYTSRCV